MRSAAVCAPTAPDRGSAGEEMGCERQKLRSRRTKRRAKHPQKLPNNVHGHSSDASGVSSQKATSVGETVPESWRKTATDESSVSPGMICLKGEHASQSLHSVESRHANSGLMSSHQCISQLLQ